MARKGLVFAMEEEIIGAGDESVVPESAVEVEQASAEMASDAGEVEEMVTAIEEAEADLETIEQLQEVAETSVEEGQGLSEQSAEIAEIAVEAISARLGLGKRIIPSLESFGSSNSRVAATRIAIEGFKDSVKRIWEAIKAAFARLIDKIKGFFMGISKNADSMSKHLENLKTRVQNIDDKKKKLENDLDNESLARSLSVKKQANLATAEVILENSSNLLKAADFLSDQVSVNVESIKSLISKSEVSFDDFKKQMDDTSAATVTRISNIVGTASKLGTGDIKRNKKEDVDYYGPFAGTRAIAVKNTIKGEGDFQFHVFSIGMTTVDSIEAKKIKALDKTEMLTLISKALSLLDELNAYEKAKAAIEKIGGKAQDVSKTAISSLDKIAEGDTKKGRVFREVASEMNNLNSQTAALGVSIPKAVFDAVKASADYVSASIANYGEKAK